MSKKRLDLGPEPQITVTAAHNELIVRGGTESSVAISGDCEIEKTEKGVSLVNHSRSVVRVPAGASLHVLEAHNTVIVKGLQGEVQIAEANNDVIVKNVGVTTIGTVHGDLSGRNVSGSLSVNEVMGDCNLRNVAGVVATSVHGDLVARYIEGGVHTDEVMGDVQLKVISDDVYVGNGHRDVNLNLLSGKCTVESASGDIRLKGRLVSGKHNLKAEGDIVVRWPQAAPAQFLITAGRVRNRLTLDHVEEGEGTFTGRIGDSDTVLVLETENRVILKPTEEETWGAYGADLNINFDEIDKRVTEEVSRGLEQLQSHMEHLSTQFEHHIGPEFAQKVSQKAEKAVERAMRELERSRHRARRRSRPKAPPKPPAPPKPSRSTESEQMKVLSMLENGVISVEEANTLLKALE